MGPDLDSKGKSRTDMHVSPAVDVTASKEIEKMACAKNCEDNSFLMEALPNECDPNQNEDLEINVTDNKDSSEKGVCGTDSEGATEYSSSFGDTDSGVRNGQNDLEVESQLLDDGSSSLAFDEFGDLFRTRKKKVTDRWRSFVRPLMWRCKWVELQVRELQAQALKYDRLLAECDQRKQHDFLNFTSENLSVKSTPFTCQNRKVNIMKRKKRRRVEEESHVASYMSQRSLLSTFVNKKSYAERPYMDDDFGNSVKWPKSNNNEFEINGGWPCPELKDDKILEEIVQKIDESQLQLHNLKVRMDKVIRENAATIFSNIEASTRCNALTSSSPKPLPCENGEGPATSQRAAPNGEDALMVETAASSGGKITPLLDMVESSDRTKIGVSCLKIKDEVLLSDHFTKEEVGCQRIGKPKVRSAVEERNPIHSASDAETVSQIKKAGSPAQESVKMRPVSKLGTPKTKRKRARRKARISKYSRRSSG